MKSLKSTALCFMLITSFFTKLNAQNKEAQVILDKTIEIMKNNSSNSNGVDWSKITVKANELAKDAKNPEDLGNSIRYLFQSLGDFHGRFGYKDSVFNWQKEKIKLTDEYRTAFKQKGNKFFTQQLGEVGYLRIPMTPQEITKERAQALQDSLCQLLRVKPKGLIFDLRLNYGGTMWPMILGVNKVLKKGVVGGFIDSKNEVKNWIVDDESIYEDKTKITSISSNCSPNLEIPLVVIIGPGTASAAEDLIVALKTRPNTTFIGEPTTGAVSVVNGFKIDNDSWINLSIAHLIDKNKTLYKDKIHPDILVKGGDNLSNLEKDSKVKSALKHIMLK